VGIKKKKELKTINMSNEDKYTVSVGEIYGYDKYPVPRNYTLAAKKHFRIPNTGDTFLSPNGEVCTLNVGDTRPAGPRLILEKLLPSYKYTLTFFSDKQLDFFDIDLCVEGKIVNYDLEEVNA
jgi:hypothetical protein